MTQLRKFVSLGFDEGIFDSVDENFIKKMNQTSVNLLDSCMHSSSHPFLYPILLARPVARPRFQLSQILFSLGFYPSSLSLDALLREFKPIVEPVEPPNS